VIINKDYKDWSVHRTISGSVVSSVVTDFTKVVVNLMVKFKSVSVYVIGHLTYDNNYQV